MRSLTVKQSLAFCVAASGVAALLSAPAAPSVQALHFDPEVYQARRARFLNAMQETGVAIIMSGQETQDDLFEGFVRHADNHDFIYLTGLDGPASRDSALLLCPRAERYVEILYTSHDVATVREATGIKHVFPFSRFPRDLSEALTDFSLIRGHQSGSKPVPTDISRSLGTAKHVYFNYPRFVNLSATPPGRLELANKLRYFSPEVQLKDASDILNQLRMVHDQSEVELLRKASAITVKAFVESMKRVRPGATTREIATTVDDVFAAERATPAFTTNVGQWKLGAGRSDGRVLRDGDLISYDIGAEYGHQTSDFGRTIPVSGTFTPRQRRIYDAAVRIQKQLIASVKPGGTFKALQKMKDRLAVEAGFGGKTVNYGISHFVGMEIHDVGGYERPFEPNVCFVIEWRVEVDDLLIRFEDVVLVTTDGYEWLTGMAPIEADEYEKVMVQRFGVERW